jgi:hypothetical protein
MQASSNASALTLPPPYIQPLLTVQTNPECSVPYERWPVGRGFATRRREGCHRLAVKRDACYALVGLSRGGLSGCMASYRAACVVSRPGSPPPRLCMRVEYLLDRGLSRPPLCPPPRLNWPMAPLGRDPSRQRIWISPNQRAPPSQLTAAQPAKFHYLIQDIGPTTVRMTQGSLLFVGLPVASCSCVYATCVEMAANHAAGHAGGGSVADGDKPRESCDSRNIHASLERKRNARYQMTGLLR